MTYPHERQIEYWTSRAIEDYFENEGYSVVVLPNSPRFEKYIPFDHLFAGRGIKIFGFQYKRMYKGTPDYWLIDLPQLLQIQQFKWIYYALPHLRSIKEHRNTLHLLTVVNSCDIPVRKNMTPLPQHEKLLETDLGSGINKVPYFRWGGFVQSMKGCRAGLRPSTAEELLSIFRNASEFLQTFIDLYIIPFESGPAFRISPFERSLNDNNIGEGFDFGYDE